MSTIVEGQSNESILKGRLVQDQNHAHSKEVFVSFEIPFTDANYTAHCNVRTNTIQNNY